MLSLRRSPRAKNEEGGSTATTTAVSWWRKPFARRKRIIVACVLIVVIVGAGVAYVIRRSNNNNDKPIATVVYSSEESADKALYNRLKKNPVGAKASVEDQAYYLDQLEHAAANVEDYQSATRAFDRRTAIKTDDLTYESYVEVAFYYHKLGDVNMATNMIDRAILLLPKQDNPNNLYYYEGELANLNELKAEYSK